MISYNKEITACWRIGKNENRKMWDIYGKDKVAVVIKSTVGNIKRAFEKSPCSIYIGKVKYINHTDYINRSPNPFSYTFLKDKIRFEHDRELGLMTVEFNDKIKLWLIV